MDKHEESTGTGCYPPSAQALNAGRILLSPDGAGSVAVAEPGAPAETAPDAVEAARREVFGDDDEPGASPATEGGEKPGTQAAAAAPGQAPAGWEQTPLPAGHPLAGKYKTLGDLTRGYSESSGEGKRLSEQLAAHTKLVRALQAKGVLKGGRLVQPQAPVQPAAPAGQPGAGGYYGEPNQEAWLAKYGAMVKQDPVRAVTDAVLQRAKHDAGFAKEFGGILNPLIEERLAPLQEQSARQHLQAETAHVESIGAKFFSDHPEAADPNHPVSAAMEKYMDERGWLTPDPETGVPGQVAAFRVLKAYGLSPFEVAFNAVQARLGPAQAKAAEQRLQGVRSRAETARPSGAGKIASKAPSDEEAAAAIAAESGITDPALIAEIADVLKG